MPFRIILAAAVAFLAPAASGDEGAQRWTSLGLPPASVAEYRGKMTVGDRLEGGTKPETFQLQVVRAGGSDPGRVVLVLPGRSAFSGDSPVLFTRVEDGGEALAGDEREMFLLPILFARLDAASFASGSAWTERSSRSCRLPGEGVLEHRVERAEGRQGAVRVTTRRIEAGPAAAGTRPQTEVLRWEREIVADAASGRISTSRISAEIRMPGSSPGTFRTVFVWVFLDEVYHRALAPDEAAGLPAEMSRVERIARACAGGSDPAAPLRSLAPAGVKRAGGALALVEAYETDHPHGVLRGAAAVLRESVDGGKPPEPEAPAAPALVERPAPAPPPRARAEPSPASRPSPRGAAEAESPLVGRPAPGFSLKDLDGAEVALDDFRGKVVLLAFWGFG
jgi:hypothetical protein